MRLNGLLFLLAILLALPLLAAAQDTQAAPQAKPQSAPNDTLNAPAGPGRGMHWRRMHSNPDAGPDGPCPYCGMGGPDRPGMRAGMLQALNLTADQRKKMHDMDVEREKAAIQNRAQLETRQLELRELLNAEKPDRAAIDRKIEEIEHLRANRMKSQIAARLDFESLLTPEQKDKLRQFQQAGPRPGQGRRRMRVGPPPRPVQPPTQQQ